MGGRTAGEISARLIAEGLPPETPVLIASNTSRPDERRWYGTLAGLSDGMAEVGYDSPVLFGVGRVFTRKAAMTEAIDETQVLPLTPVACAQSLSALSR
nr:hypothetical protein [Marinicella sp. W31]MDC2880284.1 hypothetical protein [Marinicella sp. W31]